VARLQWRGEANELFPVWTAETSARLQAAGVGFHVWEELPDGEQLVRLVTSFITTEAEVDAFLALL
jgi:threonine aldolase